MPTKMLPTPRKPQSAVYGVLKVGRLRSGDQLRVRPLRDNDWSAVAPHDRGGGKAKSFGARAEVFLELSGIRLEQKAAAADIAGGQFDIAQERATLGFAGRAGSPGWLR